MLPQTPRLTSIQTPQSLPLPQPCPLATTSLCLPWRKASLLTGWQSPSPSIKDSVSPGDTWKPDRMVFLPIFFTAEKTQTQEHIYCNVSIPKFVLKKEEEIKLVSLSSPPLPQTPALSIPGGGQGEKQSGPQPHREARPLGQWRACSWSLGRNAPPKTYTELPSGGCSEGRTGGPCVWTPYLGGSGKRGAHKSSPLPRQEGTFQPLGDNFPQLVGLKGVPHVRGPKRTWNARE